MGRVSLKPYEDLDELGQEQCSYCGGMGSRAGSLVSSVISMSDSMKNRTGVLNRIAEESARMTKGILSRLMRSVSALEDKCGFETDVDSKDAFEAIDSRDWPELSHIMNNLSKDLTSSGSWEGVER